MQSSKTCPTITMYTNIYYMKWHCVIWNEHQRADWCASTKTLYSLQRCMPAWYKVDCSLSLMISDWLSVNCRLPCWLSLLYCVLIAVCCQLNELGRICWRQTHIQALTTSTLSILMYVLWSFDTGLPDQNHGLWPNKVYFKAKRRRLRPNLNFKIHKNTQKQS